MKTHRKVIFTKKITFKLDESLNTKESDDSILPANHILLLGDVDNDPLEDSELVVASTSGWLTIFKGETSTPWAVCSGLGDLSCLALGRVLFPLSSRKQIVAVSQDGLASLLEMCYMYTPELQLLWKQVGKPLAVKPLYTSRCPCNVTSVVVWERPEKVDDKQDGDSSKVTSLLILGTGTSEVWILNPQVNQCQQENACEFELQVTKRFKVGGSVSSLVIVHAENGKDSPTLIITLQSGVFEALSLAKLLQLPDVMYQQLPSAPELEVEAGAGLPVSVWQWQGGMSAAALPSQSSFGIGCLDGRVAVVDVNQENSVPDSGEAEAQSWRVRWVSQRAEPWAFVSSFAYPDVQIREGKSSTPSIETLSSSAFATCTWGGQTLLWNSNGDSVEFDAREALCLEAGAGFGNTLQSFCAGPLSLHPGKPEVCLIYARDDGNVEVFCQLFQQIGPLKLRPFRALSKNPEELSFQLRRNIVDTSSNCPSAGFQTAETVSKSVDVKFDV